MNTFDRISVSQLDKQLSSWKSLGFNQPKEGWIKRVRTSLKMSTYFLSKKLGITQPSLTLLEKREAQKRITLQKLEEVAQSMGCRLVYAFVPEDSFSKFIEKEELEKATDMVDRIQSTMSLESQDLTEKQRKEQVAIVLHEIQKDALKKLWETS